MKIAVLSDIHSNIYGLRLALEDSKKHNVDKYVFLGDYITDGYISNEILDLVKIYGDYVIIGNREKYILNYDPSRKEYDNYKTISCTYESLNSDSINYLKTLNEEELIELNNYKILIIHGDKYFIEPDNIDYDSIINDHEDFDICLFGHFHIFSDVLYKGKRFINPGSIGIPADGPTYKYSILDLDDSFKLELREFNTRDTYNELLNEFIESYYYRINPIWSNLVLRTIKYGKDCCYDFIKLLKKRTNNREYSVSEFNKIWAEVYNEFISTYKFE